MGEQNGGQRGTLQIEGMGTTETRQMEAVYAALFVAGTVIPLSRFLPWLADHGIDVSLFFDELFVNRISSFFAWDVILAVVTLLVLAAVDRELTSRQRIAVSCASLLGASSGLPLYLLLRERRRNARV